MLVNLFKLLSKIPLPMLHAIGTALGRMVYLFSSSYGERLKANISRAGYAELIPAAVAESG